MLRRILLSLALCLYVTLAGATVHINDSGTWRQATQVYVNDSGTWRLIQQIYVNDSGTWRLVHTAFSVSVDDSTGIGACIRPTAGSCTAFVPAITCSGNNPVGSVTYAWTYVSGTNATIASPTSASTTFSRAAPASGGAGTQYVGTFRCTATDTGSGLSDSVDITITTTHVVGV